MPDIYQVQSQLPTVLTMTTKIQDLPPQQNSVEMQ